MIRKAGIQKLLESSLLKKLTLGAAAMDAMHMGTLTALFVTLETGLSIHGIIVQADLLDPLFHGLLPLAAVLGVFFLLVRRQMKTLTVTVLLVLLGAVGGLLGIF